MNLDERIRDCAILPHTESESRIKQLIRDVLEEVKPSAEYSPTHPDWKYLDKDTQDRWLILHRVINEMKAKIKELGL